MQNYAPPPGRISSGRVLLTLACLLAAQAPLRAQSNPPAQGMSPEMEAKAREVLREKMAELDQAQPPVVNPNQAPIVSPGARELRPLKAPDMPRTNTAAAQPDRLAVPPPKFDSWPSPSPSPVVRPGPMPSSIGPAVPGSTGPVVGAPSDHGRGKTLYSFRAEDLDLKAALSLFARANKLNIVPDQDVTGPVTLDVQDLPLDQMMEALLEAHDYTWKEQNGLIRVRSVETRTFSIDYLRMIRKGIGTSSATLSSSSSGGAGGGAGGGGSAGGGGAGGGSAGGGAGGSGGTISASAVNLTQENIVDFWKELDTELGKLLTEKGKAAMAINKTAGIIQITDRPSALRQVESYLLNLATTVQRQVDIEAKLYDVTLNDQFQLGLDWQQIIKYWGGNFQLIGSPTVLSPAGGAQLKDTAFSMLFNNKNTSVALTALQEQGTVSVISQPRLRTLNNQTALIKVGTDTPFFQQNIFFLPSTTTTGAATAVQQDQYQLITIGTILAITPQISADGAITLDISPVITSLVDTRTGPNGTTAPVIDIKQASTLVRVNDGETIILGGLIQNSLNKTIRKIPLIGDVPYLGKIFQGKFEQKQKKELVIFLTPTIVR